MEYEEEDFPVSEKAATEIVRLPMFLDMTTEQQKQIVEQIVALVLRSELV